MSNRGGSVWSRLDWWGKLEVLGIGLALVYCIIAAINPVLAESIGFALVDIIGRIGYGLSDLIFGR